MELLLYFELFFVFDNENMDYLNSNKNYMNLKYIQKMFFHRQPLYISVYFYCNIAIKHQNNKKIIKLIYKIKKTRNTIYIGKKENKSHAANIVEKNIQINRPWKNIVFYVVFYIKIREN